MRGTGFVFGSTLRRRCADVVISKSTRRFFIPFADITSPSAYYEHRSNCASEGRASPHLRSDVTLSERNPVELGRQSACWPWIPRQIMKMIMQV
ncbi:hypothetical protein ANANG_G00267410 [Anguilla anguilla]|uniref:Uncharacterized protein n=1 Tax=Anguilla anguilla TaxID=7936 RepID=A0A9D3LQD3_ANGAN|nr:hypothetical protein ANANG_G00267410 [Anguilla anguilla]